MGKLQKVSEKIIYNKMIYIYYPTPKGFKEIRINPKESKCNIVIDGGKIEKIIIRHEFKFITLTNMTLYLDENSTSKHRWETENESQTENE